MTYAHSTSRSRPTEALGTAPVLAYFGKLFERDQNSDYVGSWDRSSEQPSGPRSSKFYVDERLKNSVADRLIVSHTRSTPHSPLIPVTFSLFRHLHQIKSRIRSVSPPKAQCSSCERSLQTTRLGEVSRRPSRPQHRCSTKGHLPPRSPPRSNRSYPTTYPIATSSIASSPTPAHICAADLANRIRITTSASTSFHPRRSCKPDGGICLNNRAPCSGQRGSCTFRYSFLTTNPDPR